MWLLLITVATATALTLPKVEVDKALLEKYGVTDDVNEPGYLKKAVDSFNNFRRQSPSAVDPKTVLTMVESTISYSIPAYFSKQWIVLASAAQAQNLVQILVAHLLNIAQRFRITAETVSLLEYATITKLKTASNISFINECRKDRIVMDVAHKTVDTQGAFDPVRTCDNFLQAVRKDPSILEKRTAASMKAHVALTKIEDMIQNGESYTFAQIEEQLKKNPIIDPVMYDYFQSVLAEKLEDYDQVIKKLKEDPGMKQIYDSIAKKLGSVGVVH